MPVPVVSTDLRNVRSARRLESDGPNVSRLPVAYAPPAVRSGLFEGVVASLPSAIRGSAIALRAPRLLQLLDSGSQGGELSGDLVHLAVGLGSTFGPCQFAKALPMRLGR